MKDDLQHSVEAFLYTESECLDEKKWDDWLALFADDCEYWIPSWHDEHEYTSDPNNELSLMYYNSKIGLEDRIFRIKSGHSSASTPLPRTCHLITNVRPTMQDDGTCLVKTNWSVHYYKAHTEGHFFGAYEYVLQKDEDSWLIKNKKIILMNDRIPTVLDIYHI
ncbi:MAG: benzoate 1,2-dioxygenase small subunit [Gammaproteobacteria bacterium]|nr:MAG: benzoate 1,2-dioxygenase small subunit [Gammaproteobacteria bacterium]RLA24486.1 MAG: benzoate 1,2-dioxygenase small subunit [Gammaproteobacteria bacterium]